MWKDAVLITLSCVLAVQMGLVDAVSKAIHYEFHILSCAKCSSWWLSLGWHLFRSRGIVESVAVSFLSAYVALWLALALDALAILYNKAYAKIEQKTTDTDKEEPRTGPDEVS